MLNSDDVPRTTRRLHFSAEWTKRLAELTSEHGTITHEILDNLPQTAHVHHLRQVLVHAGALPPRDEEVDSTAVWLNHVVAGIQPDIARIIRQYASWSVLRRARRRGGRERSDRSVRKHARRRIMLAIELLTWLDGQHIQPEAMNQADLERWLNGKSPGYRRIQDFLSWAHKQKLLAKLAVPSMPRSLPEHFTDEAEYWQTLRRCIHDDELAHDLRVAGSLILLFGQTPARLVRLTQGDVTFGEDTANVVLGRRRLVLPSPITALLRTQVTSSATRRLPIAQDPATSSKWIFPSRVPGQHADAGRLTLRLNQELGLYVRPTRNRALSILAAELPSSVLADLLGLHVGTANRWTRLAKADWTAFVAERSNIVDWRRSSGPTDRAIPTAEGGGDS